LLNVIRIEIGFSGILPRPVLRHQLGSFDEFIPRIGLFQLRAGNRHLGFLEQLAVGKNNDGLKPGHGPDELAIR
jgi:hypothetical protein